MKEIRGIYIFIPIVSLVLSFLVIQGFLSKPTDRDAEKRVNNCNIEKTEPTSSVPLPWESFPGHFFL